MFRVLVYDRAANGRVYAYGKDGTELRFPTRVAASLAVHLLMGSGHAAGWEGLTNIEEVSEAPRTFRRLERRGMGCISR